MTTQPIPDWVIYLQALGPVFTGFGTLIIGACVAYIAWRQWQTARHKLRMDLYDRRLALYRTVMRVHGNASGGHVSEADFVDLSRAVQEMEFLFNAQAHDALGRWISRAAEAAGNDRPLSELDNWLLLEDARALRSAFRPYLDLTNIH